MEGGEAAGICDLGVEEEISQRGDEGRRLIDCALHLCNVALENIREPLREKEQPNKIPGHILPKNVTRQFTPHLKARRAGRTIKSNKMRSLQGYIASTLSREGDNAQVAWGWSRLTYGL